MSILQKIGAVVRSFMGQPKEAVLDKAEILNSIETLLQTAHAVQDGLQQLARTSALDALRPTGVKDTTPELKQLQKLYNLYFQALPSKWQQVERGGVFGTLVAANLLVITDLEEMRTKFTTLFGGVDVADLPMSELTVSMAAALGWLQGIDSYITWQIYFIGNIQPIVGNRNPPYQLVWIDKHTEKFTDHVIHIVSYKEGSVIKEIEALNQKGSNVHLQMDGHTLDTYASDTQYSPQILGALSGFSANPISIALAIGNQVNQFRRWRYESTKARREWLASKIGYMVLKEQGLDPTSAEAKRLQMLISRYAEIVATYDKRLGLDSDG